MLYSKAKRWTLHAPLAGRLPWGYAVSTNLRSNWREIDAWNVEPPVSKYCRYFFEALPCPASTFSFLIVLFLIRLLALLIASLARQLAPYALIGVTLHTSSPFR